MSEIKLNDKDITILKDLKIWGSKEDIDEKYDYYDSEHILNKLKQFGYVDEDDEGRVLCYQTNKKGLEFLKKI